MKTNFRLLQALSNLQEQTKKERERLEENQENLKEKQDDLLERQIKLEEEQKEIEEKQNKTIKETKEKVDSIKVNMPKDGKDGRDGKDGKNGLNGQDGKDGIDGKDGRDGKDGKDGKNGQDGADGIGIYDIELDKEFHLIITLTDGRRIDCGYVRGQAGMNGYGVNGISVTNAEIRQGHLYITLSNGTEIDAGVVSGGGSGGEEVDPIFIASPAYDITSQDITNWNNKSDFSGDYEDLENKPSIPAKTSDLTNDSNFIDTSYHDNTKQDKIEDLGEIRTGANLGNTALQPNDNISELVNDAGYLTEHQDISGKYDKTGGEITGNVKIDGTLTLDIEDEDYDAGIRFDKRLDNNLGTVLTLTGYADDTNYKPIIRNVGTPQNNYDVANKKYVDDNIVRPSSYLVFLNNDGTIDTYSSTLTYAKVKAELTSYTTDVYLDVIYNTSRLHISARQDMDTNAGPIVFMGEIRMSNGDITEAVFLLDSNDNLTVTYSLRENALYKTSDIETYSSSLVHYPTTKGVWDTFQRKPVVVWESSTPSEYLKGIQANLSASPAWQLTNLDLTPYKRIKIYTCAGKGSTNASTTPAMILEMSLDSRAVSTAWGNNYVASTVIQKSNDNNRLATLACAVSEDKTSFVVLWQTSLYGTAATANNDIGADVFKIEGYYD